MKILFLTNNIIAYSLYDWLVKSGEDVTLFEKKLTADNVMKINPNLVISYNYRYIINKDIISYVNNRIINLHISLLPWNRGAHPNVWAFLEDTPKGVTIHILDEGLDTGNILYQKKVHFDECKETLASSYKKLHNEIQELFISNWEDIRNWNVKPIPQIEGGTKHFAREFEDLKNILKFNNDWNINIREVQKRYMKYKISNIK